MPITDLCRVFASQNVANQSPIKPVPVCWIECSSPELMVLEVPAWQVVIDFGVEPSWGRLAGPEGGLPVAVYSAVVDVFLDAVAGRAPAAVLVVQERG